VLTAHTINGAFEYRPQTSDSTAAGASGDQQPSSISRGHGGERQQQQQASESTAKKGGQLSPSRGPTAADDETANCQQASHSTAADYWKPPDIETQDSDDVQALAGGSTDAEAERKSVTERPGDGGKAGGKDDNGPPIAADRNPPSNVVDAVAVNEDGHTNVDDMKMKRSASLPGAVSTSTKDDKKAADDAMLRRYRAM
jgi:hypothetical protein